MSPLFRRHIIFQGPSQISDPGRLCVLFREVEVFQGLNTVRSAGQMIVIRFAVVDAHVLGVFVLNICTIGDMI
jgi:hypothetical protein